MIKFKQLIREVHDVESLRPKDIFNFYYLWHTALHSPEAVQTQYGKEVLNYYLSQFKAKYVKLFTRVLANQIKKYVSRNRVDADFPKEQNIDGLPADQLLALMKKTLRSDMQRRNDKWEMVGEFVVNLSKASSPKDIFLWVNQLNNAVHNTQTRVMDKFPNFHTELNRAFDMVDKAKNVEALRQHVDKDIRDLKDQEGPGHSEDFGQGQLNEGLEKIVMSPDTLAKLKEPSAPPSSFATHQPGEIGDKKKDKQREKDVPPELDLGPLDETDDMFGTANVRIGADTPRGTTPTPVFKKKIKSKDDDEEEKKKADHFKLGPLQEAMEHAGISKEDRENVAFMSGLKMGVNDKAANRKRDVSRHPEDFQRGYNTIKRTGWWEKFNDKLTNWASNLGQSYGPRF